MKRMRPLPEEEVQDVDVRHRRRHELEIAQVDVFPFEGVYEIFAFEQ